MVTCFAYSNPSQSSSGTRVRAFIVAWFAFGVGGVGNAAVASTPADCAEIASDFDRLACFDRMFPHAVATPEATFGAEQMPRVEPPRVEAEQPRNLQSWLTAIDQRARGELTFTLANGQKWTQLESEPKKQYRTGDAVTIRRLSLGSYAITSATGVSSRVKRLE